MKNAVLIVIFLLTAPSAARTITVDDDAPARWLSPEKTAMCE